VLSPLQIKAVVAATSVAAHVWLAVGVAAIRAPKARRAPTAITMRASKPAPPKKQAEPEPPPKPVVKESVAEAPKRPAPKVEAKPAAKVAEAAPAANAGPAEYAGNFGNGGTLPVGGGGGGGPVAPPPTASVDKPSGPKIKALGALTAIDECLDPPAKPKPIKVLQPAYTDDARSAAIEGRVRVEITVDETGAVVSAKVLAGLGHGLDEAALAAAKGSTFSAAMRCGKAVRSTFTIGMRFNL
jgi:protein TonB